MTEIYFGPRGAGQDVAEALHGLSAKLAADTPTLALGGRGAACASEAVFASVAILRLFGANTLEILTETIAGARHADAGVDRAAAPFQAAERLSQLANTLPLNGPARLERLRFDIAGADHAITFLCRRLAVEGAPPLFIAAALDLQSTRAIEAAPVHSVPRAGLVAPDGSAAATPSAPPPLDHAGSIAPVPAGAGAQRFLWSTDADHRLVAVGAQLIEVARAAGVDLVGRGFVEAVMRFAPEQAARLAQCLERRESFSGFEIACPIPGSRTGVPIMFAGAPCFDDRRQFTGFRGFGVVRPDPGTIPISDRPPAAQTEALFADISADERAVVDALSIGIVICRDGAPVYANRFVIEALGYADFRSAEAGAAFQPILQRLPHMTQGEMIDLRGDSGRTVTLQMRRDVVERGAGRRDLVSLQARTEGPRPAIDAELRHYQRAARELNAILDTAMDGVAVLDGQGRIASLNRSGEALFGYDKAEVTGEAFTILVAPESRERAQNYFNGLKSNGVARLLNDGREILGVTREGGLIPLFMTLGRIDAVAATDQDGRYCALLRDMTHWKTVERELDEARREAERASALKSEFLAKVSHEIRTPLNAVLGFAEVIMEERFGPIGNERYKDYLKDIHSSGALVLSLVNDLLDLSKIEAGKMDLSFEAVDANRIVTECVSIMQPQASAARVVMRLSLAPQLPHVCADQRSVRQIVLNLLSNAIKFTQPGGQVIISTALTDANHAALRIRDTGIGMSDNDIGIALEPFRQVASSRLAGGAGLGTGLGLPLTRALVEANRAAFSIRSKVNEGTLVEVVFPPARIVANRA